MKKKYRNILVTGGAGFVGSNLAIALKNKYQDFNIIALDNLKRRGSELNIKRLGQNGIAFIHGDIRNREDLDFGGQKIDLIIECSAEPSVLAGFDESPEYLIHSNLIGTIYCLELARRNKADFVFLSTSRVYPYKKINNLKYREEDTRFSLIDKQSIPGVTSKGINEYFPLEGTRSLYGATKLAAEYIIYEYASMYGIYAIINRCGVIAGPWQMGKVDQGVLTLWMAAHYFKKKLSYIGFGGKGKQVRDIIHIDDLFNLIDLQLKNISHYNKRIFNVGGGAGNSLSLLEMTNICREITGNKIPIQKNIENRPADIKLYISDCTKIESAMEWKPLKTPFQVLEEIWHWIHNHENQLKSIL
jgi:CDP-paratose 2-epimerase